MATTAKKGSGLGARMAAKPMDAVAAGMEAALGGAEPEPATVEPTKAETVALNVRMPKAMHRTLRKIAFDEETSITALLLEAAEGMLAKRKGASAP